MRQIGAFEAKNTLGTLLDLVMQGEEIVITRHGKPVARLIREPGRDEKRERARQAAEALEALAKGAKLGRFDWQDWRSLRDEGRR
ncbi:MAG TPA: type II toxin-antitoxin system prevent-host-death family antitoxin [Beijerinckiaceae bacterium]|nr:type II toxin-antitoxin system prevent-host-death family antitoxin [Beijerinckiaceae bacterium]